MLKPTSDFVFVEPYEDGAGIVLPDNRDQTQGKMYRIVSCGPGYLSEEGKLHPMSVEVGDVCAIVGRILELPYERKIYLLARAGDTVAVDKEEDEAKNITASSEAVNH